MAQERLSEQDVPRPRPDIADACRRVCPACGGPLIEIRQKLQCRRCHAIVETCCEGGRG